MTIHTFIIVYKKLFFDNIHESDTPFFIPNHFILYNIKMATIGIMIKKKKKKKRKLDGDIKKCLRRSHTKMRVKKI